MTKEQTLKEEKTFVNSLVNDYITSDDSPQVRLMRNCIIQTFKPYISGGIGLELGCEIGYMSENIAPFFERLDIVDGSDKFLECVRNRGIPNAKLIHSLFEEFSAESEYDAVFASHVLEHLVDVQHILSIISKALKPGGYFFASVPNARSLSRQLARHMGLVKDLYELTPNDHRGGHRRVYDQVLLSQDIKSAGFEIVSQGGILFKPFADFQMDKLIESGILGEPQCEGLFSLGHEYPEMCADVYVVARVKDTK